MCTYRLCIHSCLHRMRMYTCMLHLDRNPKRRTLTQTWYARQETIRSCKRRWFNAFRHIDNSQTCLPIASSEQVTTHTFDFSGKVFFAISTNVQIWVSTLFQHTVTQLVTHSLAFPLVTRKRFVHDLIYKWSTWRNCRFSLTVNSLFWYQLVDTILP